MQRTVYTIVVITAPYRTNLKTGEITRDEVLISRLNPRNLQGVERPVFNHELIFLNPNYRTDNTPPNYRDWLDLIYESIHHPDNPTINTQNEGILRVAGLIDTNNLSPEEWEATKQETGRRKVLAQQYKDGITDAIWALLKQGILTPTQIAQALGVALERVTSLATQ